VYLWHCTADGQYSMYEVSDQNYLRGVQVVDDAGKVTFTTIFPGCYAGRWPHCHFEVYDNLDVATAGNQATKVSQLALPQSDCETVYADSRYGNSSRNLAQLSLSTDNVFSDGWGDQLATVAGAAASGVTASLLVRV
jgi:protocatechuate 3,4-dioxygenase beta subunit